MQISLCFYGLIPILQHLNCHKCGTIIALVTSKDSTLHVLAKRYKQGELVKRTSLLYLIWLSSHQIHTCMHATEYHKQGCERADLANMKRS